MIQHCQSFFPQKHQCLLLKEALVILVACAYKPNSVPLDKLGTTVIYLDVRLPQHSSGTPPPMAGTRPCIQVRILPFHPSTLLRASPGLYEDYSVCTEPSHLSVEASLLAPLGLLPTGVTRYPAAPPKARRMFGLSSI